MAGGIVFIFDPYDNSEVTSFPSHDFSNEESGTKVAKPILLEKAKYEKEQHVLRHHLQRTKLFAAPETWRSHTVMVLDMSGFMRRDDLDGAKCRSDGVWLILARDFISK
jgi:hypothetical protein